MKMKMKIIISVLLSFIICGSYCSCSEDDEEKYYRIENQENKVTSKVHQ